MNLSERPIAFHFAVRFSDADAQHDEILFQQVSGLEAKLETEPIREGGENTFVHRTPKAIKDSSVVLKRGVSPTDHPFLSWCKTVLEGGFAQPIQPRSIEIRLMGDGDEAAATWKILAAYPIAWSVGGFEAMSDQIALETIELSYSTLKRSF